MKISMLAGFTQGPFYYDAGDAHTWGTNHVIEDAGEFLGPSMSLINDLTDWDNEFQSIYNSDDPRESNFPSAEAEVNWIEKGKELAVRIKRESPVVTSVDYQADGSIPKGTCIA
ncbi:hypothetical protein [Actinoalloteichus fjordicus]|uniref:Uncharacterized protein n=1 Tax=Actinoalloteichus fjordicus TaxID=1612552 RepID=A0AAC9LKS8_9PSEU|nr:hypothetical protein [Actinoalloteichus fjordicus]APU17924.1 hypothetical protein UA74_29660 [Actinoalloteichus fjordicus]